MSEKMTRVMAAAGFEPARVYNAFFIEFSKTYADAQGRLARAVVQFDRPTKSTILPTPLRLSGFTVLVQAAIDASETAVLERAPPIMQEDLLAVVAAFADDAPPAVTFEACGICGRRVSEFFVVRGVTICRACKVET